MRKYVYSVIYVGMYDNTELYCGARGIFPTSDEAEAFILEDMDDTLNELGEDFEGVVDREQFSINDGSQRHQWFIDVVFIDCDMLIKPSKFK